MRITQEADYALRIMSYIAKKGTRADAKEIADETNVPPRFTIKILRKLSGNSLLKSFKGAGGGYMLADLPAKITMRQIVETIDGPLTISRCLDQSFPCTHTSADKLSCVYYHVFDEINYLIAERLEKVTLQTVLDKDRIQ